MKQVVRDRGTGKKVIVRVTTVPQSLWKLLEGQLRFFSANYQVIAISSPVEDYLSKITEREGVETLAVSMDRGISLRKDLVAVFKMYKLLRELRPDIVHTHTPKAGLVGILASWLAKVPIRLHTVAGLPLETASGAKKVILLQVERLVYKLCTAVYPNSHSLYNFLLENNLCKQSKLKVIGHGSSNGIDLDFFSKSEELENEAIAIRTSLGIKKSDFVFLFMGRLVKDKGINELCVAFDNITDTNKNVKLILLGRFENDLDPISQESARILADNTSIFVEGYKQDVRPYLSCADAFVFPTYREGLPNALLQAQAFGLPSVVTAVTGNVDIVDHLVNGILVDVASVAALEQGMIRVLGDSDLRVRLGANARESICSRYSRLYVWRELGNEYRKHIGS